MEMQNIADQLLGVNTGIASNDRLIQTCTSISIENPVGGFHCPSAADNDLNANDPLRRGITMHYIGSAGPSVNANGREYDIYQSGSSESGPIGINGLFSPYSAKPAIRAPIFSFKAARRSRDMSDGQSNILAISEASRTEKADGSFIPHRVGWTFGANGGFSGAADGYVPTDIYAVKSVGLNSVNQRNDYLNNPKLRNSQGFHSNHSGGVNLSLADGSVHFVADETDVNVLIALSSVDSGESASVSSIK